MAIKPHLKLNTETQFDGAIKLQYNYGFGEEAKEDTEIRNLNYTKLARSFRNQIQIFNNDFKIRLAERTIEVPTYITYVRVEFHGQFHIPVYFQKWYNDFGLTAINYSKFNTEVLFAVNAQNNLNVFLTNIQNFIRRELENDLDIRYDGKVKFIKKFRLLTTADILEVREDSGILIFNLTNFPLNDRSEIVIRESFFRY